jgi:signal recognition particle subunit SRP54
MFKTLSEKFLSIFTKISGNHKISESNIQKAIEEVKDSLVEADVPYEVVNDFIENVKIEALGENVLKSLKPSEQFIKVVHKQLQCFLGEKFTLASNIFQIPSVIMVMGLQGSGKTTTIAKLAKYLIDIALKKGKKRNILLSSVDFYRPAAIDQLEILSKQVGASFFRSSESDPVRAAKEIYNYYKDNQFDHLFLDTAGRLHVDNSMLQELKDLDMAVSPNYKLLVLDAMTGQESLNVAMAFDQTVSFSHAILTKMDSETRAGAALAFRYSLKKPIIFVGVGEKIDDLEVFHPDRVATKILGMGDILTLIEQAEIKINKEDQEKAARAFSSGNITLEDFISQIEMVEKMGSLSKIAQYMPGLGGKISQSDLEKGERELVKFKAIVRSMTKKERVFPRIIDISRKERIAKGSGTRASDVNLLINRFEQSKQFVKLFNKSKKFGNLFR